MLELLVSKELISYPRPGKDHMLYSDEVVVGRFLNEKDGGYSEILIVHRIEIPPTLKIF